VALRTIEIPQADALASVRQLIEAVSRPSNVSTNDLARDTGFSDRHVRYRMATARILDLVADGKSGAVLTARGRRLLRTTPGSSAEKKQLRQAIEACGVVQEIAPGLLSAETFDFDRVAKVIVTKAGLSQSTAERRAQVLRAWGRQLA
jgi:hypothetical protein